MGYFHGVHKIWTHYQLNKIYFNHHTLVAYKIEITSTL